MTMIHRLLKLALLVSSIGLGAVQAGALPPAVPGTVQAGDYDAGVEGEWLSYTLNATSNFLCRVRYRSAATTSGPFQLRLELDGDTRDVVLLEGTGGATNWTDTESARAFPISAGLHTARVTFVTGGVNLDEIEFSVDTDPVSTYLDPSEPVSNRVAHLLSLMTVEEKVGQMCLVDRSFLYVTAVPPDKPFPLRPSEPNHQEADIRDYRLGGIFSGGGSSPTPNTPEAWADMVDRFQAYALETRLHIPVLYASDAVHGHNNLYGATIFPHAIGLGAAGDADLVKRLSEVAAREMAATGVRWTFAPSVSVSRSDFWGRVYEGYAETPDIVGELGAAAVRGYQGDDLAASTTVLATAKHYAGDGGTEGGVDTGNTILAANEFLELHVAPYEDAVSAGCLAVMASLSSWNGDLLHGHTNLLTDVLKGDMGFEGFILSDWEGIDDLVDNPNDPLFHGYYLAIIKGVNAGLDMIMIPHTYKFFQDRAVYAAGAGNAISDARLNDAVGRILTAKFELGLFEDPYAERSLLPAVGSPDHRAVAREAVSKSMVILKNDSNLLPLPKDLARIHVAGGHANNLGYQCGGWTISWQGGSGNTTIGTTIFEAITNTVSPATTVTYSSDGSGAAGAEVGIVVVGETPYAEFVGDTSNLNLGSRDPDAHSIIQNVQAEGIPVIVIIISGRPLMVESQVAGWNALIAAWLPGTEGQGIADVLFGDFYPSSTLAYSWPRTNSQVPINVRDAPYDPLYAYGCGLSLNPVLRMVRDGNESIFSWSAAHTGFQLEEADGLTGSPAWNPVPGSAVTVGGSWVLTNEAPSGPSSVHRLRRP